MMIEINRVGVVGARQTGTGIARACAAAGFAVSRNDRDGKRIDAAFSNMDRSSAKLVSKGKLGKAASHEARKSIVPVPGFADLAECDLVIEAATENEATKRQIFSAPCPSLRPDRDRHRPGSAELGLRC